MGVLRLSPLATGANAGREYARFAAERRLVIGMLRCEECGAVGRVVLQVRDAEDVDPPFTVVYCRACAEREFGSLEAALDVSAGGLVEGGRLRGA